MFRINVPVLTAQIAAVLSGRALAVLPAYMASSLPTIAPVIPDRVRIQLTYWMSVHNDLARSPRVRAVMDGIEELMAAATARCLCLPECQNVVDRAE